MLNVTKVLEVWIFTPVEPLPPPRINVEFENLVKSIDENIRKFWSLKA